MSSPGRTRGWTYFYCRSLARRFTKSRARTVLLLRARLAAAAAAPPASSASTTRKAAETRPHKLHTPATRCLAATNNRGRHASLLPNLTALTPGSPNTNANTHRCPHFRLGSTPNCRSPVHAYCYCLCARPEPIRCLHGHETGQTRTHAFCYVPTDKSGVIVLL